MEEEEEEDKGERKIVVKYYGWNDADVLLQGRGGGNYVVKVKEG